MKGQVIPGKLISGSGVWNFTSDHPDFVALFPSHSVTSFLTEHELAEPARRAIYQAVAIKVAELEAQNGAAIAA